MFESKSQRKRNIQRCIFHVFHARFQSTILLLWIHNLKLITPRYSVDKSIANEVREDKTKNADKQEKSGEKSVSCCLSWSFFSFSSAAASRLLLRCRLNESKITWWRLLCVCVYFFILVWSLNCWFDGWWCEWYYGWCDDIHSHTRVYAHVQTLNRKIQQKKNTHIIFKRLHGIVMLRSQK